VTVRALYTLAYPRTKFGFTGVGYDGKSGHLIYLDDNHLHESVATNSHRIISDDSVKAVLAPLLYSGCLCNNATLIPETRTNTIDGTIGNSGAISGQPTELALIVAAMKAGYSDPRPQYHRLQEMPFSSDRKRMDVRARPVNGKHVCAFFQNLTLSAPSSMDGSLYFIKGMPEKIISECATYCASTGAITKLDEDSRTMAFAQSRRMAASGLRVIALGYGPQLGHLTFAGLIGMEDPPRDGVADSVRKLRHGGIKCLMITGDAKETAMAIAKRCSIVGPIPMEQHDGESGHICNSNGLQHQLLKNVPSSDTLDEDDSVFGMGDVPMTDVELASGSSEAMSGSEIDEISIENLAACINGIRVFYRVSPRHKLAIVRALQRNGEIVCMTGDGVVCTVICTLPFTLDVSELN
jgi:P-type Ca2+ transporter type 2C